MPQTAPPPGPAIAARLIAELMPIAILVAGPGAANFADDLSRAGASAEASNGTDSREDEFDLAILLAYANSTADSAMRDAVATLACASPRLLFIPLAPLGSEPPGPDLASLTAWFEIFAEHGFQPVIDFDASFVASGAFLVDRAATAAESDLTQFAERVSLGGALAASTERVAALEAELADAGDRAAIQTELQTQKAQLASQAVELAALRHKLEETTATAAEALSARVALERQNEGWDALRRWVWAAVTAAPAEPLAKLRTAMLQAPGAAKPRGTFQRWLLGERSARPTKTEQSLLDDWAVLRAASLFDAPWYIACHPELADRAQDPALHYLLTGARQNADPGPWFDTQAYLQAHPQAARGGVNPLVHAIRSGAVTGQENARPASDPAT